MSLICGECNNAMANDLDLPGRNGVFVYPNIIGLAFTIDSAGKMTGYTPSYVEAPENLALCFECIEKQLPKERKPLIELVYDSYKAEMESEEHFRKSRANGLLRRDESESERLYKIYRQKRSALPNDCIFTGLEVKDGKPFFKLHAIDAVNSTTSSVAGPLYGFGGIYQVTGKLNRSASSFVASFDFFKGRFPSVTAELSFGLRGVQNPKQHPTQISLGPGVKEAIEKELGKPIDELISKFKGGGPINVVWRDSPKRKSKG